MISLSPETMAIVTVFSSHEEADQQLHPIAQHNESFVKIRVKHASDSELEHCLATRNLTYFVELYADEMTKRGKHTETRYHFCDGVLNYGIEYDTGSVGEGEGYANIAGLVHAIKKRIPYQSERAFSATMDPFFYTIREEKSDKQRKKEEQEALDFFLGKFGLHTWAMLYVAKLFSELKGEKLILRGLSEREQYEFDAAWQKYLLE